MQTHSSECPLTSDAHTPSNPEPAPTTVRLLLCFQWPRRIAAHTTPTLFPVNCEKISQVQQHLRVAGAGPRAEPKKGMGGGGQLAGEMP